MPTQEELVQMYSRVTVLQKIVTLQQIHSLYLAAQQAQPPRKDVSFNILQLQKMINNNPLINPDFDFLDIQESLSNIRQSKLRGEAVKNILTPIQIVQVIAETLAIQNSDGKNEQVIAQIPKTTVFMLSNKIGINFVKERLVKILNNYKNSTLKDITALEMNYKKKRNEIQLIENGKIPDVLLRKEFVRTIQHLHEQQKKKGTVTEGQKKSAETKTVKSDSIEKKNTEEPSVDKQAGLPSAGMEPLEAGSVSEVVTTPKNTEEPEDSIVSRLKHSSPVREGESDTSIAARLRTPQQQVPGKSQGSATPKKASPRKSVPEPEEGSIAARLRGPSKTPAEIASNGEEDASIAARLREAPVTPAVKKTETSYTATPPTIKSSEYQRSLLEEGKSPSKTSDKIGQQREDETVIAAASPSSSSSSDQEMVDASMAPTNEEQLKTVAISSGDLIESSKSLEKKASEETKTRNDEESKTVPAEEVTPQTPEVIEEKKSEKGTPVTPKVTPSPASRSSPRKRHHTETYEEDTTIQHKSKRFQALSLQLLSQISSNRFASMFLQPVNAQEEPHYYELIREPVDLRTLLRDVRAGNVTSFEELEFKLQLMFSNAVMYNDISQTETYKGIIGMMEESRNLLNMFKETIEES
ncbi:DEKNAAC102402 [Brettanomyces naardenensis]|uniref:DEKNAAC102402 n=1 Tax=Brettanomyces naardenensis TaxID=13370 RepID=A0A448YKR6_BRENA|nr:DEKNAAC102402 [Brettanomyces naardenensis]